MNIVGLQKLTLLDYPGKVACTVFIGGCNMRCPFCHNSNLIATAEPSAMQFEDFFSFLESRQNLLSGVCISGGEPTLSDGLIEFARRIKQLGYSIKLDTNGSNPDRLGEMIKSGLLDYVAMDIKSSRENYTKAAGCEIKIAKIEQSIALLLESDIEYEFRTTLVRELHIEEDIIAIGEWIRGAKKFTLQNFQPSSNVLRKNLTGFSESELKNFASILRNYVNEVTVK